MGFFNFLRRSRAQQEFKSAFPTPTDLITFWRHWITHNWKSWVLFQHGTCVVVTQDVPDPRARAIQLLKEWGPVEIGSPAGDFNVLTTQNHRGWVIACHHPDIVTYVGPDEVPPEKRDDLSVGLYGRGKRDKDAAELEVIHVELVQ